ncbi:MAG: nuclear transport factor 2 family protein, partial [Dermatophilaceae bacterium]
ETAVRAFFRDCWNGRDYAAADRLYAGTFTNPAAPGLRGGSAKAGFVRAYHEAFPDLVARIEQLVATDTTVTVRYVATGTDLGGFHGRAPTGRSVTAWAVSFLQFTEEHVTGEWAGVDYLGVFEQLGVVPSPWGSPGSQPAATTPAATDVHGDDSSLEAVHLEHEASEAMVHGDSRLYKALCSHSDDISLAGRGGAYEHGWAAVADRYDWVAGQYVDGHLEHRIIASGSSGDLAYTFELISGRVRFVGEQDSKPVAVRATHVYRREPDGWKLLHRHADQLEPRVARLADIDQSWLDDEVSASPAGSAAHASAAATPLRSA